MSLTAENRRQGIGMTSQRTRERLIQRLAEAGISHSGVLEAMRSLPRHLFVDEALASRAYEDSSLPIGHGQTISQPYTVARMTEALLEGGPRDTVLEIGTGSGFQTAVLAALVRRVYSVERYACLHQEAEQRLRQLELRNVRLRHGDGGQGGLSMPPSTVSWSQPRLRGYRGPWSDSWRWGGAWSCPSGATVSKCWCG
jgi:protein-L-isoaspartate(D-aspartate) O-methyltransferase